ncbi:MAG TPA: glycosyltransferase [Rhodothermales bacterium]|nr:glycosyltransferase [Rhodothermales bacterium]
MVAKQRAAHVTTVHNPLDPRIYRKEIATLRAASYETWLIARDTPGRDPDPFFLGVSDGRGLWDRLRRHVQSLRHIHALRPRVVHIHDPELIPLAYLARAMVGCKVIYDMHEDYAGRRQLGGRLLRVLERWCFRWVDHVILAEASYESILRGRSTPSTPVLNYVLPPHRLGPDKRSGGLTLIYTGTISNSRGLSHMLDLAAEIKRAGLDWRMKIVGVSHIPAERARAEQRIAREGLDSVLERVGWDRYVPWSEIVAQYADAHLGLALFEPLPNHVDSLLSKFYEYIYFGQPVIHSDFPLWRAFFETNGCGASVDPTVPGGVLKTIEGLINGPRLEEMENATRAVREEYVWSNMESRLVGVYADLLAVSSHELDRTAVQS